MIVSSTSTNVETHLGNAPSLESQSQAPKLQNVMKSLASPGSVLIWVIVHDNLSGVNFDMSQEMIIVIMTLMC